MKHTISVLVKNESGVLSRVADLFSGRGYNIESLTVAPTLDNDYSRITIVTNGEENVIEQITKQLNRLIPVIKVVDLNSLDFIEREFILCKVQPKEENKAEILRLVEVFGAKIIEATNKIYTIEAFGDCRQINSLIELLKPMNIKELVRSGHVAISRENQFVNIRK